MVDENELRQPQEGVDKLAEEPPVEDSSPQADLPERQDAEEHAEPVATQAPLESQSETGSGSDAGREEDVKDEGVEQTPLETSPDSELAQVEQVDEAAEEELEAAPLEGAPELEAVDADLSGQEDLAQADQEAKVEVRLGADQVIEEAASVELEPVAEMVPGQTQEKAAAAGTTRRKSRAAKVEEQASRLSDEGGPDFSQVPQPDGESDGRAWYVVHCYSGYENKVRHNLEQRIESMGMKDKIFDVVVPTEEEIEVKEGKRRTVERRVFPGYILVNMILSEESWYVVRNTPGVTSFVGQGNTPLPLRPEEVSLIVKRMEADAPRIKVTFKQGERVRIVDGPFNDFRGTVSEIDMERAKVRVMVNFFGRETPVELDFLQVEKA